MSDATITLEYVVNGEPVRVLADTSEKLISSASRARAQTNNIGRPIDDWEIRRENGLRLGMDQLVGETVRDGETLYLTIAVGFGASRPR